MLDVQEKIKKHFAHRLFCRNLRRLLKTVTKNNHDETNPYTHRP